MTVSPYYLLGVAVGLLLAFAVIALGLRSMKKKRGPAEYDERQKLVRGECYRAAFWVLSAYLAVSGLFTVITGVEWAEPAVASFLGFCLAATVFVLLCIRRDAYFMVNERPRFYTRLFSVVALVETALIVWNLADGKSWLTDGRLNHNVMNAAVLAMFLAVLVALALRRAREKAGEA